MTSSAALSALRPNQLLPLLRERQGAWRQRDQLQRIGLYSFGEACGYGSTARGETPLERIERKATPLPADPNQQPPGLIDAVYPSK